MQPWPAESTKRSRSGHFGSRGSCLRWRCHSTYAIGAAPSGRPGWPEFAFWTASIASVRIVSTQSSSMDFCTVSLEVLAFPRAGPTRARIRIRSYYAALRGRGCSLGRPGCRSRKNPCKFSAFLSISERIPQSRSSWIVDARRRSPHDRRPGARLDGLGALGSRAPAVARVARDGRARGIRERHGRGGAHAA